MTEFPIKRRNLLRATGAGLVALCSTGASSGGVSAAPATEKFDFIWEFEHYSRDKTATAYNSSVTVVNGVVYVGSPNGNLYALNAETGTKKWKFKTDGTIMSSPVVKNETVYVGSLDENLYAVDTQSGKKEWSFTTGDKIWSSPTVNDGAVYIGSDDGNLYALNAESGANRVNGDNVPSWIFRTEGVLRSSPVVIDETLFIGTNNGVYALRTETAGDGDEAGSKRWRYSPNTTEQFNASSPTVINNTVYIGSDDGFLYSIDATSGTNDWTVETRGRIASAPTVSDGTVYVATETSFGASRNGGLYAVNKETGAKQWDLEFEYSGIPYSSPTIVNDTVFVAGSLLKAVDAASGEQKYSIGGGGSSPVVVDGTLFVKDSFTTIAVDVGVTGSSEGSRVNLGTLGHHNAFAESGSPPPGGGSELDLSVQAGTAPPGGTYTLTYQITNTGSTTIGDDTNSRTVVSPEINQDPPGFTTNERSIPDGGAVDGFTWFDWSIDPGETITAELQVALEQSGVGPPPGDYEFTIVAEDNAQSKEFDRASGTVTVEDAGGISLTLAIADTTAEASGTATVTYILTNEGNTESSGLQGRIDLPSGNWQLGESGSFTSLGPGESDSVSAEVLVPESASGEYTIDGSVTDDAGNKATASGTVTVEPPGEPSWTLTAQAFQPVDGPGPLPAQPGETFRLSLVITNTGTVPGDASIQFVSASSGEHNADYYGDQFAVESHTDDGGEWFVEGWRWDENTDSGPIAPDETREPVVELAVAEDVSAGEYTFAISGPDGAMATATVTVAPLDGTRQQKLALAGRIDDAATFDSLLTREPSTRAFQPEQEVARNSLDLLEESVPDGSLSRETAIDAANRLIWGEQLTEDVLQYTGDATITTDVTELPDDLNIAQQTAGPLLKVVVSLLLQAQAGSKIVSSISQKLPGAVSINPDQIEGVANKLLDIALGFKSETDDVPADAPDTTDPTTLLEDLQPEVATIVEEIENGVTTSVDAVLSTIDAVVQPFIDVAAGTLRVFLEHIALSGTVTEGVDAGLSGAVTNLHSALRPEAIASGGLAGSQSQAEEAYTEGGAGLIQTAVEVADVLDGFGTQEKLRDSTELAVNVLKLEPEEIDVTTIVEFAKGPIPGIYGEALDLGLGIGFMLNLHASHSNAHTGIINGA